MAEDYKKFAESLSDTALYSVGAYFSDRHPELVDEVIAESDAIGIQGLQQYADANSTGYDVAFETLLTGLAVRYYKALVGG